jgi:hypothetical protein
MRAAVVIAVCFLLPACAASPTAPDISFRLIGHGGIPTDMRPGEPSGVVIRESGAWSDFVRRSGLRAPSFNPDDPIPSINFSSEMALALLLGQRPTTGYQIRIGRITQRDSDTLVVAAVEIVPCAGATVITYPLTAFAVPRSDHRVTVEWSREGPNCQGI